MKRAVSKFTKSIFLCLILASQTAVAQTKTTKAALNKTADKQEAAKQEAYGRLEGGTEAATAPYYAGAPLTPQGYREQELPGFGGAVPRAEPTARRRR